MAATQAPVPDERADRHALTAFVVENPDLETPGGTPRPVQHLRCVRRSRAKSCGTPTSSPSCSIPRQSHGLGDAFVAAPATAGADGRSEMRPSPVSPVDLASGSLGPPRRCGASGTTSTSCSSMTEHRLVGHHREQDRKRRRSRTSSKVPSNTVRESTTQEWKLAGALPHPDGSHSVRMMTYLPVDYRLVVRCGRGPWRTVASPRLILRSPC